ncbi:MAG: hypothetical protein ACK6AD_09810 [Cyanobacteriota bacterium]
MAIDSSNLSKTLLPLGFAAFIIIVFLLVINAIRGRGSSQNFTGGLPCIKSLLSQEKKTSETSEDKDSPLDLSVNVGIDASQSLSGFVNVENSRFATVIQKLDNVLREENLRASLEPLNKIGSIRVNYWRIGTNKDTAEPKPLLQTRFLDARFPKFFCAGQSEEYPCVSSSLHQILDIGQEKNANSNSLSPETEKISTADQPKQNVNDVLHILITDLEPDNSAIGELTSRITKRLSEQSSYKAALVGIRSEFDGKLYATDVPNRWKNYKELSNPDEKGRPFYLFLLGPGSVVDSFVDQFYDSMPPDISSKMRLSYFQSPNLSPLVLNVSPRFGEDEKHCLDRLDSLNGNRTTPEEARQWLILRQTKTCEKNGSSFPAFNLQDVKSTSSLLLRGGNFKPDMFKSSEPFVSVTNVSLQNSSNIPNLNLSVAVTGEEAESDEQAVNITLSEKALDQAIWQDWSASVPGPLEGDKTQQLIDFVSFLRNALQKDQDALRYCLGYVRS